MRRRDYHNCSEVSRTEVFVESIRLVVGSLRQLTRDVYEDLPTLRTFARELVKALYAPLLIAIGIAASIAVGRIGGPLVFEFIQSPPSWIGTALYWVVRIVGLGVWLLLFYSLGSRIWSRAEERVRERRQNDG